jgi:hypothetical protein
VGRFVRTLAGRPLEHSYLFLPADQLLRAHAAEVEEELCHVLRAPAEEQADGFDEVQRRASEPTEPEPFVPLNADVAPQLALFGGGPPPPAVAPPRPPAAPPAAPPSTAAEEPVFHRRRRLRDKRQGLVVALAGMEGRSHREINTWLNREIGSAGVREASIEQLERSVELLQARLDRIGRRRASRAS